MLSWVNWLDDVEDPYLLSLWVSRCCALWFGVLGTLSLRVLCWVFLNDVFCSGNDRDSPSCWVDWIRNCFKIHQLYLVFLLGVVLVGIDWIHLSYRRLLRCVMV